MDGEENRTTLLLKPSKIRVRERINCLVASFSEAEDLYRFFELRGIGGNSAAEINRVKSEMRKLITTAYGDLDPAVKKQIELARRTHRMKWHDRCEG